MYGISQQFIMVINLSTNRYHPIRATDFKPYDRSTDPTYHTTAALRTHVTTPPPASISSGTSERKTHAQPTKYSDGVTCSKAHNTELYGIDSNGTVHWLPDSDIPPDTKLMPLKMTYRYKRHHNGNSQTRKARHSVRGGNMMADQHYEADKTTTYMAEKLLDVLSSR